MTRVPQLTPRLLAVARQVPLGARLADVGTDHAHLPVCLLRQEQIQEAIASDIRENPLERGKAVAKLHGVADKISFRLCSGLADIRPEEVDTVVIAGMGGETITSILQAAPWVKSEKTRLLLQPMSSLPELRLWLQTNGFVICREEVVPEGRRFYVVMTVEGGQMAPLSTGQAWAGCQSPETVAGPRGAYLEDLIHRCKRALAGRAKQQDARENPRMEEQLIAELEQMRKEWESWQR